MISVLLYHQIAYVTPEQDPLALVTPPHIFERQMAYLHQAGYKCLSLKEAVQRSQTAQPQAEKVVVITFDDGFRDLYEVVWPILDQFGFTATVFFVAGRAGGKSDWEGQGGNYAAPLLSWHEVRELNQYGFAFASHTLTHPRLPALEDKQILQEVKQSKVMIEDQLSAEVDFLSYPYGQSDPRVQQLVAQSGYQAAFGVDRSKRGQLNQWRAQCGGVESQYSFALKASGWHQRFIWLRESRAGSVLRQCKQKLSSSYANLRRSALPNNIVALVPIALFEDIARVLWLI